MSTIGDRLRVRGLCANAGKDHPSVAANVLSERMALFSGRSRSSRRGAERKAVTKRSWTVSFICVADRCQSRIATIIDWMDYNSTNFKNHVFRVSQLVTVEILNYIVGGRRFWRSQKRVFYNGTL